MGFLYWIGTVADNILYGFIDMVCDLMKIWRIKNRDIHPIILKIEKKNSVDTAFIKANYAFVAQNNDDFNMDKVNEEIITQVTQHEEYIKSIHKDFDNAFARNAFTKDMYTKNKI